MGRPPPLFGSSARELAARAADFAAWRDKHGGFGSPRRSHAWIVQITCPDSSTARCHPTALSTDLRCDCDRRQGCCCVDALMYRGACRGCGWEGEPRDRENAAAAHGCDAWPGWRDTPVAPQVPEERKKRATRVNQVAGLYPPGWIEDGGPIRTSAPATPPGTYPTGLRPAATT